MCRSFTYCYNVHVTCHTFSLLHCTNHTRTALFCSTTDGDGSTVLHHLGRAKLDSAAMFRELKKNNKINDALLDVRDKNGDTVLLVASEGELYAFVSRFVCVDFRLRITHIN